MNDVVYVIDADSGWEQDADVVWAIDEGIAAYWSEEVTWVWE